MMRYVLVLILSLSLYGCLRFGDDMCGSTTRRELASPDGKYTATSFIRDCGATTSFSPQVHLREIGEKLDSTGNVSIGNRSDEIEIYRFVIGSSGDGFRL